jgi:hypothetical protein
MASGTFELHWKSLPLKGFSRYIAKVSGDLLRSPCYCTSLAAEKGRRLRQACAWIFHLDAFGTSLCHCGDGARIVVLLARKYSCRFQLAQLKKRSVDSTDKRRVRFISHSGVKDWDLTVEINLPAHDLY